MEDNRDEVIDGADEESLIEIISDALYRCCDLVEVISEGEGYVIAQEDRIGKKYKLIEDFFDIEKLLSENPKIKIYEDRGFKFGDYVEFLISYDAMISRLADGFIMDSFAIDNVLVQVENPSFLFDVVMNRFGNDKYYDSNYFHTISLKGIAEDNYEEYLTKALFLIGYFNESTEDDSFPSCYEFLGEFYWRYAADEDDIKRRREQNPEFETLRFCNVKYFEALAFYNEAKRLHGHEISFQYFYKVLEHFFLVCRQGEFVNIINEYNCQNDIDKFISSVTDIYKQNEEIQLKVLLNSIASEIAPLLQECFVKGVIGEESIEAFAEALYLYRNTIVHGKSDERFAVKTPSNVGAAKESFWNATAETIAMILIEKYCLS